MHYFMLHCKKHTNLIFVTNGASTIIDVSASGQPSWV